MTIRATLFLAKTTPEEKETYGFKSSWEPDRLPELKEFEESILDLIQNVEFKANTNKIGKFQEKLKADIKKIRKSEKIHAKADKTNNFYKMSKEVYQNYLDQNIQKDYKKCTINKMLSSKPTQIR